MYFGISCLLNKWWSSYNLQKEYTHTEIEEYMCKHCLAGCSSNTLCRYIITEAAKNNIAVSDILRIQNKIEEMLVNSIRYATVVHHTLLCNVCSLCDYIWPNSNTECTDAWNIQAMSISSVYDSFIFTTNTNTNTFRKDLEAKLMLHGDIEKVLVNGDK